VQASVCWFFVFRCFFFKVCLLLLYLVAAVCCVAFVVLFLDLSLGLCLLSLVCGSLVSVSPFARLVHWWDL
jgi:hypothetical protein